MIIVDRALEKLESTGRPIRVGLVGAGYAARGFALQLVTKALPGIRLVAVANRTLINASKMLEKLRVAHVTEVTNSQPLTKAVKSNIVAVTTNPLLLTRNPYIDVIVEATGSIEYAANVVLTAIKNKKHVVLINAELDATVGPILNTYADRNGVVYTQADGDQPAVLMNLYREVQGMGLTPVMAGNVKGLLDHYRSPHTQIKYAKEHGINPRLAASFADGTKISQEMATVANAMGFRVLTRGMRGPKATHVDEAVNLFSKTELMSGGFVDYLLGAQPAYGVFIIGHTEDKERQKYLKEYKMGEGPFYVFSRPYHLSPLEAPFSVARAVLFHDATIAPQTLACEVVAVAKKDLKKGEILDGSGGFALYGTIDNAKTADENLLPLGVAEGCTLLQDVAKDTPLTYSHVKLPKNRLIDRLRAEQKELFQK